MSSEGSISVQSSGSRIRQFGLYRTIDARTEEFLRLSRKRQIRQGCACAAASTAITVTVVVVVFFVYEFSLNSETNLENKLKSNWLSLMNDTSDISSFDSKYRKANIDRTTLKLLPLLIKAINKNSFLEKLLEDNQNTSSSNEKRETTEKNVEANTFNQNWFKFPTTKLYAIEYKSSPVVYYKTPTQNIEYYTKIRKIRDHERIFNYVDKMISEKVYIGATRPMLRGDVYTEIPVVPPTRQRDNPVKTTLQLSPKPPDMVSQHEGKNTNESIKDCKCPHLGTVLSKILTRIQKLLPETNNKTFEKDAKERGINVKYPGSNKQNVLFNTLVDATKLPKRPASPVLRVNKDPKVSGWYDSKYKQLHIIPSTDYHSEPSIEKTTELNNFEEHDFPVFPKTTHSNPCSNSKYKSMANRNNFLKKQTLDNSDENRIYLNIFGPNKGASSLGTNYLQNNADRQMDTMREKMNFIKKGKFNKKSNIDDPVVKKIFKSFLSNDRNNINTQKLIKQSSYITTKKTDNKILIDDKLLFDFLKDKLDSFSNVEKKKDVIKMNTNDALSKTNSSKIMMMNDLKQLLDKNINSTTLEPQKSNETNIIDKSIGKEIEHVVNSTSLYKINEVELENDIIPKTRHPKDIVKVTPKKVTNRLEGSNHVLGRLTEKDIELLTGDFKGHTKNPENIIDKAVQKLLNKKYEFDVEWEDVDIDMEPNLITAKPKQRSSYLQIGRTEGKNENMRDDEFSDHIYYETINNQIM